MNKLEKAINANKKFQHTLDYSTLINLALNECTVDDLYEYVKDSLGKEHEIRKFLRYFIISYYEKNKGK